MRDETQPKHMVLGQGSSGWGQLSQDKVPAVYLSSLAPAFKPPSQHLALRDSMLALHTGHRAMALGRSNHAAVSTLFTERHHQHVRCRRRSLTKVEEIEVQSDVACARQLDGSFWCWRGNVRGRLGDSTGSDALTPNPVVRLASMKSFDVGSTHCCAVQTDGSTWSWGHNIGGSLGVSSALDAVTLTLLGPRPASGDKCNGTARLPVRCQGRRQRVVLGNQSPGFPARLFQRDLVMRCATPYHRLYHSQASRAGLTRWASRHIFTLTSPCGCRARARP